jgi:uncharacterized protein YfaT (DUF1175 family)
MLTNDEELKVRIQKLFDYDDFRKIPYNISAFFVVLPRLIFLKQINPNSFTE